MTAASDRATPLSVVTALYLGTKTLHTEAERTGVIRDMLRGEASRDGYVMLLRNLLPAYRALENGLARHAATPGLSELAAYRLDRASALEADLAALAGANWVDDIAVLPEGEAYAARISEAATGDGSLLIAHAYTRYLGDLSGGQILQRLLGKSLALTPQQGSFYDFPRFTDLAALKSSYRAALDRAGGVIDNPNAVIAEGNIAFTLNIALSCAIKDRLASNGTAVADAAE